MPAGASTRWGFHQLADRWAERLVHDAGVEPGDLVLDVGAGNGAITRHLVAAGARVLAVELHPGRASLLRQTFDGLDVKVLQVDAGDLWLPSRPFRVVANPPFAITTGLLTRLVGPHSALQRADVVVPRHVAVRWAAGRGGRRSRRPPSSFDIRLTTAVPRQAFRPPAPGDTAVLTLSRRCALRQTHRTPSRWTPVR